MAKTDFFGLNRPDMLVETKTFGKEAFTLGTLDNIEQAGLSDLGDEMFLKYEGDATRSITPKATFPIIGGTKPYVPKLNRNICYQAAVLFLMQRPDVEDDRYTFEEFIAMSITKPKLWDAVTTWRIALQNKADASTGEETGTELTGALSSTP